MKSLRMKKKKTQILCFEVLNWMEVDARDPSAVTDFEGTLPPLGALPGNSHITKEGTTVYCVTVENPSLAAEEVLEAFAKFGFQVRLVQDTH